MAEYKLTPEAREHLFDIWHYTANMWGQEQADTCLDEIKDACERLAEYPHLGMERFEIGKGYSSFPVNRHIVFYEIAKDCIQVIGVLHEKMDVKSRL